MQLPRCLKKHAHQTSRYSHQSLRHFYQKLTDAHKTIRHAHPTLRHIHQTLRHTHITLRHTYQTLRPPIKPSNIKTLLLTKFGYITKIKKNNWKLYTSSSYIMPNFSKLKKIKCNQDILVQS